MTKYEWEKELRRNLSRIPNNEAERALSYYDELFADKAEQGYSEREIINEFGNPFDVANSIIRDYEAERGNANSAGRSSFVPPTPQPDRYNPNTGEKYYTQEEYDKKAKRAQRGGAVGALVRIVFLLPYFIAFVTFASLLIGFSAAAVGCIGGGLFGIGISFTLIPSGGLLFGAGIGASVIVMGVGGLFLLLVPVLYNSLKAVSKVFFGLKSKKTEAGRN